jgi:hypothetical protein
MGTSFSNAVIQWTLTSTVTGCDSVTYEYECPIPNSDKKYHLSKVVSPDGARLSYSIR